MADDMGKFVASISLIIVVCLGMGLFIGYHFGHASGYDIGSRHGEAVYQMGYDDGHKCGLEEAKNADMDISR